MISQLQLENKGDLTCCTDNKYGAEHNIFYRVQQDVCFRNCQRNFSTKLGTSKACHLIRFIDRLVLILELMKILSITDVLRLDLRLTSFCVGMLCQLFVV